MVTPEELGAIEIFSALDRLTGKGVSYGAARSEAPNTHGLDVQIVGAGNSGGQAALFFSTHARTVTIICRGEGLEKSMSHYLINQVAERPNISTLFMTEVISVHGETSLEAIDVRNSVTGDRTRLSSGGLFLFIGASPETASLPAEITRDGRGFAAWRSRSCTST